MVRTLGVGQADSLGTECLSHSAPIPAPVVGLEDILLI